MSSSKHVDMWTCGPRRVHMPKTPKCLYQGLSLYLGYLYILVVTAPERKVHSSEPFLRFLARAKPNVDVHMSTLEQSKRHTSPARVNQRYGCRAAAVPARANEPGHPKRSTGDMKWI